MVLDFKGFLRRRFLGSCPARISLFGCPALCGILALQQFDGVFKRFTEPPAVCVGNVAEGFDGFRSGLHVELRITARDPLPSAADARRGRIAAAKPCCQRGLLGFSSAWAIVRGFVLWRSPSLRVKIFQLLSEAEIGALLAHATAHPCRCADLSRTSTSPAKALRVLFRSVGAADKSGVKVGSAAAVTE